MDTATEIKFAVRMFGTQRQLADALGVSRQTVKMWIMRGYVTPAYLLKFCKLTGAKPERVNPFAADILRTKRRKSAPRAASSASVE